MLIKGTLFLFSETGTEGGYWAIQDRNYIFENPKNYKGVTWDYKGLHYLQDGDYLKIFKPDGTVYWEGGIHLKMLELFKETANGFWIHSDQVGISREVWALPFFAEYQGELTTKPINGDIDVVWYTNLDKRFDIKVTRTAAYTGELTVSENDKVLFTQSVGLMYDALFGPDVEDVDTWQRTAIEFVDSMV